MLRSVAIAFSVFAFTTGVAFAQAQRAVATLFPSSSQIKAGETGQIAVRFTIMPTWHLYWVNPGETGMAPRVEWKAPAGVKVGPLQFPTPKRIGAFGEPVSFGYEKEVVLLADVSIDEKVSPGPVQIEANLNWLACQDVCISEGSKPTLTIEVGTDGRQDERFNAWRMAIPKPDASVKYTVEINADQTSGRLVAVLPADAKSPDLFPPAMEFAEYGAPRRATEAGADTITIQFRVLPGLKESKSGDAVLAYTDKDGRRVGVVLPTEFKFSR